MYWCRCSETSTKLMNEGTEIGKNSSQMNTTFNFKIQDRKGHMHRFSCGMWTCTVFYSVNYLLLLVKLRYSTCDLNISSG